MHETRTPSFPSWMSPVRSPPPAFQISEFQRPFHGFTQCIERTQGWNGRTPESARRQSVTFSSYCWQGHCRGLYQTPAAARLWNSPGTGCATAPASCRSKGIIIYLEGGGPRYCFRIFATIVNSGSTTFEISNSIAWPSNRLAPRSSNP